MKKCGIVFLLLIAGCVSAPTAEEFASAYYGSEMSQDQCQSASIESMRLFLKDAQSAQYDFKTCEKGWMPVGSQKQFGYFIKININAKNSFGGYVGYKPYQFLIRDSRVVGRKHLSDGLWFAF